MKKRLFVFVLLTGLFALSCNREAVIPAEETPDYVTIDATLDDGDATKTYLDGVQVKWEAGDQFQLWYGTLGTAMKGAPYIVKTIQADARQATFNGLGLASEAYMGVYPLSASVDCSKKGKLTVVLPTGQTGVAGSFASGANVAVAYSTTTTLGFQNVGGLLAFKISADGGHKVTSVRLSGTDALSGEVEIKQAALPAVDAVTAGVNYVTLSIPDYSAFSLDGSNEGFGTNGGAWGGEVPEAGTDWDPASGGGSGSGGTSNDLFYFVALPGSHTAFTLTLIDDAGQTAVASSSHAFEIERNSNTLIADLTVPSAKWHADATVYINEVSDTQIELYNPGGSDVDLSGWVLRSGEGSWALLPGTSIAAGGFLTVTAGQATCATGPMFEMGSAGFTLSLENGKVADSVDVTVLGGGESYGRTPDGSGVWDVYSTPSFGETNANGVIKGSVVKNIYINEVDCKNKKIELYNASSETVDVSDWIIYKQKASTDSPDSWAFSNFGTTTIAPGEYLVLTAKQKDATKGPTFGISGDGGFILWLKNGETEMDRIDNGSDNPNMVTVPDGSTYGRVTDAADLWMLFVGGSIGSANNGYAGIRLNEVNGNDYNAENGNDKFVEIYNAGPNTVSLAGCTMEKDGSVKWTGNDSHVLAPDTYLVLYSNKAEGANTCPAANVFSSGISAKSAVRVQLFNPAGSSLDDFNYVTYSGTPAPASYGRNANGVWYYQDATPGAVNTDGKNIVTGLK